MSKRHLMNELPIRVRLRRQPRRQKRVFISGTAGPMQPFRDRAEQLLRRMRNIRDVLNNENPAFDVGIRGHPHDKCLRNVGRCTDLLLIVGHEAGKRYHGRIWRFKRQQLTVTHAEVRKARQGGKPLHCFIMGDVLVAYKVWCDNRALRSKIKWGEFDKRVFKLLNDLFSKGKTWRIKFDGLLDFEQKVRNRFQVI